MKNDAEVIYSVNDLMELLQVKRRTILKYIKDGKIKAFKLGNTYRITEKQFNDFIKNHTVN